MSTNSIEGLPPLPPPPPRKEDAPVVLTKGVLATLILTTIFVPLVLLCTGVRLWIKKRHGWRWDDLFVIIGVIAMLAKVGVVWGGSCLQYLIPPPMWSFYMMASLSVIEVYMARLSILAIIYVLAPDSLTRRFIKAIGVVFFIMGGIMIGQLFWTCEPQVKAFVKLFPPEYPPFCVVTRGMVVTQLIFSILCDSALILIPLKIVYQASRDKRLWRRLAGVFLASVVTTIISMIAGALNVNHNYVGVLIASHLEGWLSLLVCNFGILFTAFLRRVYPSSDDTYPDTQPKFASNPSNPASGGITVVTLRTSHFDSKPSNSSETKREASSESLQSNQIKAAPTQERDLEHGREMH